MLEQPLMVQHWAVQDRANCRRHQDSLNNGIYPIIILFSVIWGIVMKCDKCGAENPDYANFCQECGNKICSEKFIEKS